VIEIELTLEMRELFIIFFFHSCMMKSRLGFGLIIGVKRKGDFLSSPKDGDGDEFLHLLLETMRLELVLIFPSFSSFLSLPSLPFSLVLACSCFLHLEREGEMRVSE